MIGRIYLLKSSEAERRHTARWRSSETASPCRLCQNSALRCSAQSGHLADQQKYHSYVSVLLSKGAFKVFRFQCAPSQASFSVCPCPKRSFLPARIQKHPFKLVCTQSVSRVRPNPNRPLELACAQSPFMPSRVQNSTSRLLESKAPLHDYLHPKPLMSSWVQRSPSCPPESKVPLVFA